MSSIAFLKYTFQGLLIPFGVLIRGSSDGYNEPWEVENAPNWLDLDQTKENMQKRGDSSTFNTPIRRSQKVLTRGWWDPKRGKRSNFEQVM